AARVTGARRTPVECAPAAFGDGPLLTRTRHRRTRERLQGGTLLIFRATLEDGWGRVAESTVVPLVLPIPPAIRADLLATPLGKWPREISRHVEDAVQAWRIEAADFLSRFAAVRLKREEAIAGHIDDDSAASEFQPGLFDRRGLSASERQSAISSEA